MHQVRRVFKTANEPATPNTLGTVRPNQFRPASVIEDYRRGVESPTKFCGQCGTEADSGDKFCRACGQKLNAPVAQEATPARPTAKKPPLHVEQAPSPPLPLWTKLLMAAALVGLIVGVALSLGNRAEESGSYRVAQNESGSSDSDKLTQNEWEEFVDWCNRNYTPSFGSKSCGGIAKEMSNNLDKGQWDKACVISFIKRFTAEEMWLKWLHEPDEAWQEYETGYQRCSH